MDVDLEVTLDGIVLPVRAQPGARRNAITGTHDGCLKVSVTQAPEKGKANAALAEVIASGLGLKKSQVRLLSGDTNSRKKFLITEVTLEEVRASVSAVIDSLR